MLYIEPKQHNVPVLYDVLFAFQSHNSFFPGGSKASAFQKILIIYNFRPNKPSLKHIP